MSDKIYAVELEIDGCRHPSSRRFWSLEEANKYAKAGTSLTTNLRYIVVEWTREWTRGEEREVTDDR